MITSPNESDTQSTVAKESKNKIPSQSVAQDSSKAWWEISEQKTSIKKDRRNSKEK